MKLPKIWGWEDNKRMEKKNEACLKNETVLIQSIICSKKVKLIAFAKTKLKKISSRDIQFIPDPSSIQITTTLLKDLIVIQGFVKGSVIVDGRFVKKVTLSFQEEVICEGACPGDELKHTKPILEGILPPQVIPNEDHDGHFVLFKAIFSIQVTVVREKIGTICVTIIGDINEERCKHQTPATAVIPFEMEKAIKDESESHDCHCHYHDCDEADFPCMCEEESEEESSTT
jgi:hypothetical protein